MNPKRRPWSTPFDKLRANGRKGAARCPFVLSLSKHVLYRTNRDD
jgi:hypothetical protein